MCKTPPIIIGIILILAIIILLFGWYMSDIPPGFVTPTETITLGHFTDESSTLIYVAQDLGFFSKNGLEIIILTYPSGMKAVQAMEREEINISICSEYPVAREILYNEDIAIVGSIDKYYGTILVARKDRDIDNITDLHGKNISLSKKAIAEFYMSRFFSLNNMSMHDVTIIDKNPVQAIADLAGNGSIDAAVVRRIIVESQSNWQDTYSVWPVQNNQSTYTVIACRWEWIRQHPEIIRKFVQSLAEAEKYVHQYPERAKAIVQTRLNVSDKYIDTVWDDNQISLILDRSLLLSMTDEAQWMITNNQTDTRKAPNFLNNLYLDAMNTIKPESVNIIR